MAAKLHIGVSFDLPLETRQRASLPIVAAFPVAALVAFVSLIGILFPTVYARETPNWAAQEVAYSWSHHMQSVVEAGTCRRSLQIDFDEETAPLTNEN